MSGPWACCTAPCCRSKYPRAIVRKIDTSAAGASSGVEVVLTAKDVPGERLLGHIVHDWPVMIAEGEETRYVGDALVVLAADYQRGGSHRRSSWFASSMRSVRRLLSPEAAMADGAPLLHPNGNLLSETVNQAGRCRSRQFAEAKHVVTQHYSTPRQEHAFLEPESPRSPCQAPDGTLTVYTRPSQGVYDDHHGIVEMLGSAGRQSSRHRQTGRRRVRRQGGSLRAAPRRVAGLAQRAAR
jgi:CO/xanthine dehydrogenase Mo-binding subunit